MEDFKHYRPLSSQTLIHREKRYHIFLSFRGADVRKTLVDHLYQSLSTAGLNVFLDSERLEKGDSIGISLQRAIQSSAIHIPIFSAHYALSPWCLKELSLMWDFKSISTGTTIIPLFYNVEPSDVRYPDKKGGPYAEAFHKHYTQGRHEHHEITAWKAALFQVSSLSGWSLTETALGYEGRLVKQVVTDVLKTLNVTVLDVAKRPVGLKARTEEVIKLLKIDDSRADRLIVGIWGMGGLGKSTLAKAIYNEIHHLFEASSFASEVRATAGESTKGLRKLQQHVLQDLMKAEMKLKSADQGKMVMRNCLASIRALVILDDVSDEKQVDALVGDWYGQGSRIIITSRDKSILEAGQVDAIYHMNGLDIEESTQLFSWHAFLRACPDKGYKDMTERIVKACRGLPLSLEIIGAHLYGKRNIRYWSDALTKIENVEYEKIYQTLKISYDALPVQEKRIFLDIACFFITLKLQDGIFSSKRAYNMDFYIKFWGVLGCRAVYTSLQNLEGKSLIVIQEHKYNESEDEDQNDELGPYFCEFSMHNQIRDLGRRMVEEESWDDPAQRSRVWREEDIFNVLARKEEMSSVRGVMWKRYLELQGIDSLQAMHNLEFMLWWDLHLRTQITIFPLNLRYLVLSNCQLEECEPCLEELPYLEQLEVSGSPADELPTEMYPLVGGLSVPVQRETRCEAILFCFVLCSKENVRVPEMRVETTMLTADTNCSPFKNFKLPSYSVANDKEKNILRICVYKGATRFKFVTGDVISCSFTVPEQFAQQGSLVRHIELLYLEGEKEDMNSQNATRFLHQWKLNVS
ncbi:disease resistance protein RUN1 isoform X2 [Cryptomeria japonica]|uniref:disease resistance protein RUN1 isoform X2 n=1 Tax=Cryptomeria japonica TaxID=3369 RepID=UPI0025AC7D59|nr:disease resistance protein RUN1 isoform X2 [Cryptomeria japonica]